MQLLIAILLAYGITNIVTQGSIFYSFREWFIKKSQQNGKLSKIYASFYKLLNCPMCFGFWAGILVGIFMGPFPAYNIIFNGAIYSGTTWIIFCLTQFLGQGYDPSRTINVVFNSELVQKTINNTEVPPQNKSGA
jgi:hypothetical protein